MQDDYECPRCHHVFPSFNKIMHDARCSVQNPFPLDKDEIPQPIGINKENIPELKESTEENGAEKNDNDFFDIKANDNYNFNFDDNNDNIFSNNYNNNLTHEYPNKTFICQICNLTFMEKDRNTHMQFHNREKEEEEKEDRMLEEEEKKILQQMEKRNPRRFNNNNNNFNANFNNINNNHNNPFIRNGRDRRTENRNYLNRIQQEFQDREAESSDYGPDEDEDEENDDEDSVYGDDENIININNNNNNNRIRIYQNIRNDDDDDDYNIEITNEVRIGPNIQINRFSNNNNRRGRMNNNHHNYNRNYPNRPFVERRHRDPFNRFNYRMNFENMFENLNLNSENVNATDSNILNELPDTKIEDVTKLDNDKKNCVICLEDFINGDEALFLPCIHLFHKACIKNWLEKNNTCPICKFELTSSNIHS